MNVSYRGIHNINDYVNNHKSKWYIKKNDKYLNIFSDYDKQCLVIFNNKYYYF